MINEMRRKNRELSSDESIKILIENDYGTLSTISNDGYPYGVPISYVYIDNSIYFHCALEGHKLNNLNTNNKVSFCVVGKTQILPNEFSTKYESVIVFGKTTEIFNTEKNKFLLEIVKKYSANYIEEGSKYIEKAAKATRVFKINIDYISGKSKK
ncbi:MAG: pyridoxamine 5'-phosphate oxidase family protein [Sarcina sp.]